MLKGKSSMYDKKHMLLYPFVSCAENEEWRDMVELERQAMERLAQRSSGALFDTLTLYLLC
jgi:hypothetical protein